jgi:hypothetical protein
MNSTRIVMTVAQQQSICNVVDDVTGVCNVVNDTAGYLQCVGLHGMHSAMWWMIWLSFCNVVDSVAISVQYRRGRDTYSAMR